MQTNQTQSIPFMSKEAKVSLSFAFSLTNKLADKANELIENLGISLLVTGNTGDDYTLVLEKTNDKRAEICDTLDLVERMYKLKYTIRDELSKKNQDLGISTMLARINENKEIADSIQTILDIGGDLKGDEILEVWGSNPHQDRNYHINPLTEQIKELYRNCIVELESQSREIREEINKLNHLEKIEIWVDSDIVDLMRIKC